MPRTLSGFAAAGGLALAAFAPHLSSAATPMLTTLFSFDGTNGANPDAPLIMDAQGNLLGTTMTGGGTTAECYGGCGTVFEVAKTANGYASAPTTLVRFDATNGAGPSASLIADAEGNLFGTTTYGGSGAEINNGNVFEVAKTKDGYASTPTVLFTFDVLDGVHPEAGLIIDADGNLFGTASAGGASFQGTVFELPKTAQGYASTPTVLVSFNGANGANPEGGLIFDAAGKLFGTTTAGGAYGFGTVFEIAKTKTGYTTTPTTLVSFDGSNGASPDAALMFNRKGDLLGTTAAGGPYGVGTVFEIAKMKGSYASRPSTLVSFNVANGDNPFGGLIADARGDLFGSTVVGGANQDGTIFELAKTRGGYAPALTTLVSFNGTDGFQPVGLLADAKGDLLGPTYFGGASNDGTVFELTGSGFVPRLAFAGTPGSAECYGQSVLSLLQHDRNLDVAAATRGLGRAEALQTAISEYCGTLAP